MAPALLNNRYRTIRLLGSGGFGETFLAEDTYMPSTRRCVIKQLKPVTGDPQMYQLVRERFQREAAVLEELGEGSSQIPNLYAYFSEGGQFYLVQEWIEGVTLTEKVRAGGRLKENEVRAMVVSLLPVLNYIHSQRIVHRDIKPDNIILRHRDGLPVLIDFGAVKEAMGAVLNTQGNPTNSIVIGTPGFMPSEQAAGRPLFSSDLYALALTAIFLLTGRTPQELEVDPRSGEFVWHQYASHITPGFVAVLDKAIQSHPRDRYHNAPAMLSALQSLPAAPAAPAAPAPTNNISQMETQAVSPGYSPAPPRSPAPPATPATPATPPSPSRTLDLSQMETQAVSPGYNRGTAAAPPPSPAGEDDWRKPAIVGGIVGAFALIGLLVARSQPSQVGAGGRQTNSPAPVTGTGSARPNKPAPVTGATPARPNTPAPKPTPKPTPTPQPQAETSPEPKQPDDGAVRIDTQRVTFSRGSTDTTVSGTVAPGEIKRYLVKSAQGQQFTVVILGGNVKVEVYDQLDQQLGTASGSNSQWTGTLPSSGDYTVEITSQNRSQYAARIEVLPNPSAPAVSNSRPSPDQAVRDYYTTIINTRQYQKGWTKLSYDFKRNHSRDSFASYLDWWQQVERVDLQDVNLVQSDAKSAVVDVRLAYIMKNGRVAPESQRLSMIWDAATSTWLIDDTSYR